MPAASTLIRATVKSAAVAVDAVRRPAPGVVVMIYHRVGGGSGLELDLSIDVFEAQADALAASGRVVSLGEALTWLARPTGSTDEAPVVITFDDGTADFVDHAVPILERYHLPATLYAATSFIDEQRLFLDAQPVSWQGLADACTTGLIQVGSHTHGHKLLDRLHAAEIADELDRSIELIGEHLGQAPLDFAYPKAVAGSADAERAVRQRFRSAALGGGRPNRPGSTDAHRLARTPVQASDGMRWFHRKLDGGMATEETLRRVLNRWRYAGDTT